MDPWPFVVALEVVVAYGASLRALHGAYRRAIWRRDEDRIPNYPDLRKSEQTR